MADQVYYELSWSILSTIGIANLLFGLLVCGITTFSQISIVPLATSAAGAIANGLCYYAFYTDAGEAKTRAAASVGADIFWLIQEAGLPFYSYIILSRVLHRTRWYIFAGLFWTIITTTVALRIVIASQRVQSIVDDSGNVQILINRLHMGYFISIALVECVSAFFLLTMFNSARTTSVLVAIKTGLFRYLIRSTEVRLALLAVIGVIRAITYSFQASAQSATNVASQIDRFAYTLECLFPIVMYIDMLASKLVFTDRAYGSSQKGQAGSGQRQLTARSRDPQRSYVAPFETNSRTKGRSSSQENIVVVAAGVAHSDNSEYDMDDMNMRGNRIKKTVEYTVTTA